MKRSNILPKFVRKLILWVFIIMLSVSFVVYLGGGVDNTTPSSEEVGRIGNFVVENSKSGDFVRNYRLIYQNYQAQGIDINEGLQQYLVREAFIETGIGYLLERENKKNKITLSDQQILNSLKDRYFSGEEEYKEFLKTATKDILRGLEKGARDLSLRQVYQETFTKFLPVSHLDLEEALKINRIEKKVILGITTLDEIINQKANNNALLDYFKKNYSFYKSKTVSNNINNNSLETNNSLNGLSEKEIFAEYELNQTKVKEDFLLENSTTLFNDFKKEVEFKLGSLFLNKSSVSEDAYLKLLGDLKLKKSYTDYFSYYSEELKDVLDNSLLKDPSLIKKIFLINKGNSKIFEKNNTLYVVWVDEERVSKDDYSSFVIKQFKNQLLNRARRRIINSYYQSLFDNSGEEIIFLGRRIDI